ncbi:MAG: hypothetical protein AB7S87_14780 [Burkholderiales bacterium]
MRTLVAVLFLSLLPGVASAETYDGIPERFFALLAQGKSAEAIDKVYATNAWVMKNTDQITNLKGELAKLGGLLGKYAYHELLVEAKAGSRYAHLVYVVGYERQPLRFELRLYRPSGEWRFQGLSFDAKLVEDVDKSANARLAK